LFATGQFGVPGATGADKSVLVEGLFWGGGWDQLKSQFIGSATVTVITVAAGLALMYAVKATKTLRISAEGERQGIDIHEHGAPAYHPEMAYMGQSFGGSAVSAPSSAMSSSKIEA